MPAWDLQQVSVSQVLPHVQCDVCLSRVPTLQSCHARGKNGEHHKNHKGSCSENHNDKNSNSNNIIVIYVITINTLGRQVGLGQQVLLQPGWLLALGSPPGGAAMASQELR